jgi:heptaprenyl diphosphate synthase
LIENPLDRVREQIEQIWKLSGAGLDFIQTMRQALPILAPTAEAGQGSVRWLALPYLCCQAAGGDPRRADDLAAAWYVLSAAAHLMDAVEDRDEPDPTWAQQGPAVALSAATGLFFTASLALNDLFQHEQTRLAAAEVIADFYTGFMRMSSGQHADLTRAEPTLEQYWDIARDKSGAFFQAACRGGARLADAAADRLDAFGLFGQHLGILKQILDDLEDIQPPDGARSMHPWPEAAHSLPVVYALSVFPPEQSDRLRRCLQNTASSPPAVQEAFELLEKSGAALYLRVEIDRHRDLAIEAIRAAAGPAAAQPLISLVEKLAAA